MSQTHSDSAYFCQVQKFFDTKTSYNSDCLEISSNHAKMRVYYNFIKACLMHQHVGDTKGIKLVDLGSGSGVDLLKFAAFDPVSVILVDLSTVNLSRALQFYESKNLTFPVGVLPCNVATDAFFEFSVKGSTPFSPNVPKKLTFNNTDLVCTFGVLEFFPTVSHFRNVSEQIFKSLQPGASWIGCVMDTEKLLERLGPDGKYSDRYCKARLCENENLDRVEITVRNQTVVQNLCLTPCTLRRIAKETGFVIETMKSAAEFLGDLRHQLSWIRHLRRVMRVDQPNNVLQLEDLVSLNLLHVFAFRKSDKQELLRKGAV